ncbi:APC family permease [Streptomyces sp. NPDC001852]|uniref:APC family permease n=1 Tax=Streptomyces sp. NPDC001852 TaxID=3364619 RepID=UPI00369FC2B3
MSRGPGLPAGETAPVEKTIAPGASAERHRRAGIGVRSLVIFYVTSIVGTGILYVPGVTAEQAGPSSLLAWTALAAASYPFAKFFAEMSAWRPDASGLTVMVRLGFGERSAQAAALLLIATYVIGNPVMGIVSARYFLDLVGHPDGPVYAVATVFMALSVLFNTLGLHTGARVQAVCLVVLLTGLGVSVALAAPHMDADRYRPFLDHGWGGVGAAVVSAFFSFLGWENVSTLADDVSDPARSYRRAVRWAVPVIGMLYLSVTAAYLAVPSRGTMVLTALLAAPLGQTGRIVGGLVALGLAVVATNAWVLGASRLVAAGARDGLLPRSLAVTSVARGVPVRVLPVLALCYAAVLGGLSVTGLGDTVILTMTSSSFLMLYVATAAAAIRARAPRAIRRTGLLTLLIALGFLCFGGVGLLLAAVLAAVCAALGVLRGQGRNSA